MSLDLTVGDAEDDGSDVRHTTRHARRSWFGERSFVGWDGEGYTDKEGIHHYCLFGNSDGIQASGESLSTVECFELMLQAEVSHPSAVHIGFAFEYDVNMMLRDVGRLTLVRLRKKTFAHWVSGGKSYRIEHVPKKWFQVSGDVDGKRVTCRIQDVFSFFASSFVKALRKWGVGSDAEVDAIEAGKEKRGDFRYDMMEFEIVPYWRSELELLVGLADKLRSILYSAGLRISQWYGPGNLATFLFKKNRTADSMNQKLERKIVVRSAHAYAGGRFERFRGGLYLGPVYAADINSAYPYALSRLPNMATGRWETTRDEAVMRSVPTRLGLYYVSFVATPELRDRAISKGYPLPKFNRMPHGGVVFPLYSEGWVHADEARMLARLYPGQTQFLEATIYWDDDTSPFSWVADMYEQRAKWKRDGNPAELALKLGLNSLYGKLAQRVGWDEETFEPPTWHQLEWAGAITSTARTMLQIAARNVADGLIAVETDGIYSTVPFTGLPNGAGMGLGQWELEEYTGILFLQSGVYWLRDSSGKWLPPKSRGIPQKRLRFEDAMECLKTGNDLVASQNQFIGYGMALHRNNMIPWRRWVEVEKRFSFGDSGKRIHNPVVCDSCKSDMRLDEGLHTFMPIFPGDGYSETHSLPWMGKMDSEIKSELSYEEKWEIFSESV